jgi:hypothetical protein
MLKGRKRLDAAIKERIEALNIGVKSIYFEALKAIVKMTPEDKGRAIQGWFLSVANPSSALTGGGVAQLSKMPKNVLGKKIFFTNSTPYINKLEYGGFPSPVKKGSWDKVSESYVKLSANGFSEKAPNGFVRVNLKRAQMKIKQL